MINSSTGYLLKLDNDEKILDFKTKREGLPIWPFLRIYLYVQLEKRSYDTTYSKALSTESDKTSSEKKVKLLARVKSFLWREKLYIKCRLHNKKVVKSKKYLYYKTNKGRLSEGIYHENVFDDYIRAKQSESIMLKSYKAVLQNAQYACDILYEEGVVNPIKKKKVQGTCTGINDFKEGLELLDYIEEKYGLEGDVKKALTERLLIQEKENLYKKILVNAICDLLPELQLVVMSEAGYSYYCDVCNYFHNRNIPILEIQHGMLFQHPVYNYGDALIGSEVIKRMQPDYFGVWSEYWGEMCHMNPQIVLLANREIEEGIKVVSQENKFGNNRTKIVFCIRDVESTFKWADEFIKLNRPDLELVLRPHPKDDITAVFEERYGSISNVLLDKSNTIYECIRGAKYLVAEHSTVIWEAEACGVCSFNVVNDYGSMDEQEGIPVNDMGELIRKVDELLSKSFNGEIYKERFFGSNLVERFEHFLEVYI